MDSPIPEDIRTHIWKIYFKEHVVNTFMEQVNRRGLDAYPLALNRRTGLNSIYLQLDTEDPTTNQFQVCCDYGYINDYNWEEGTPSVNLPDCKQPKYCKHNSRY
jgi:hypothetical protein